MCCSCLSPIFPPRFRVMQFLFVIHSCSRAWLISPADYASPATLHDGHLSCAATAAVYPCCYCHPATAEACFPACFRPGHAARISSLLFSPSSAMLVSASSDGCAQLWDVRQNCVRSHAAARLRSQQAGGGGGGITCLHLDVWGGCMQLLTAGWDGAISSWDLRKVGIPRPWISIQLGLAFIYS